MSGYGPVGSLIVGSLPTLSNVLYNVPSKITYYGSNAAPNSRFNTAGQYIYNSTNIITPTAARHVSWIGAEVLHSGHGLLRVSSTTAEVLHTGFGYLHVSSVEVEVLHNAHAFLRISQICVEVLRSIRSQDDAEVGLLL